MNEAIPNFLKRPSIKFINAMKYTLISTKYTICICRMLNFSNFRETKQLSAISPISIINISSNEY